MNRKYTIEDVEIALRSFAEYVDENEAELDHVVIEDMLEYFITKNEHLYSIEPDERPEPEHADIPVTYASIMRKCGWSKFAEVTGRNPYYMERGEVDPNVTFYITLSHADQLGL